MIALPRHRGADRLHTPLQDARLVLAAGRQQQSVQRIEVGHARHRDEVVAPEIAALSLNAAFLMPLAGGAELRGKPPVRAERHEPHRLLPPMTAQDLAHGTRQVVMAQQVEHAAEAVERTLVRFQERLLRRVQVGAVERRPAGHRPHREHLHPGPFAAEVRPGLVPVDLRLLAPAVALRHEGLAQDQPHLALARPDMVAHRQLRDCSVRKLPQDPPVDATRRVPLLARGSPVLVQHTRSMNAATASSFGLARCG